MNANWGGPGEGLSFPGLFQPQQQQGQPMFSFPQEGPPPLYNSAGQPSWDQQLHQHANFPSGGEAAFQPQGGGYQPQQSFQHVLPPLQNFAEGRCASPPPAHRSASLKIWDSGKRQPGN